MSEPASPEVGFLSGTSVSLACFCYCLDKTSGERKANRVVGTWVLTDLSLWGFEKFTAACFQAVFPGQLQVCMCVCVSSREAWSSGMPSVGANWLKFSSLLYACGESRLGK